jgi:hypothetical protein
MKKAFLLLLLISSYFADAQSLKDALFSAKLKNSPGMVIRKGDDLSQYIDTSSARKVATDENGLVKTATVKPVDPSDRKTTTDTAAASVTASETTVAQVAEKKEDAFAPKDTVASETAEPLSAELVAEAKPKDNKAIWKEYMTSLVSTLQSEVLSSKKVKKGSYYVMVSYTIGTDGQVTITDLYVDPKNEFLQQQIKERIDQDIPKLEPELNSSGAPRKVNRKYSFTLDKE